MAFYGRNTIPGASTQPSSKKKKSGSFAVNSGIMKPAPVSKKVAKPKAKKKSSGSFAVNSGVMKPAPVSSKVARPKTAVKRKSSSSGRSGGSSSSYRKPSTNTRSTTTASRSSAPTRSANVSTASVAPEPEKEKVISFEDFLAGDSPYSAAYNEIQTGLGTARADYNRGRADLNRSMRDSLESLGLDFTNNDELTADSINNAQWNASDTNRGYGQGRAAMTDSAASRGMLDSSFFADELTNYDTQFNDQRTKLLQQLLSGRGEYDAQEANAYQAANSSIYNAVTDAADRYAAQFGVDAPTADAIKRIVDARKLNPENGLSRNEAIKRAAAAGNTLLGGSTR